MHQMTRRRPAPREPDSRRPPPEVVDFGRFAADDSDAWGGWHE